MKCGKRQYPLLELQKNIYILAPSPSSVFISCECDWAWLHDMITQSSQRVCERQTAEKLEREEKKKISISSFNTYALFGESRGLRVHLEAPQGAGAFIRASLTEAIWRAYGRFTVFSEGPAWAPWKLLNWEMSESGRRIEQCFVSEGEGSHAHQERSHKARSQRHSDTNLLAQWHAYSHWAQGHKPHKGRSKYVCRVPISISRF